MSKKQAVRRIFLLILVSIIFVSSFYFFFKNSRASSPRNNKEYMEQLTAASKRYNTAGRDISEIDPNNSNHNTQKKLSFIEQILELFIPSSK